MPAFAGEVPDFRLDDLENRTVRFSELQGRSLTILDFWATWCQPCRQAIPHLIEIYEEYQEQGVVVLGVNVDGNRSLPKVRPFSRSLGITYPVLLDKNSDLMSELRVTGLPTLLIVDRENRIVFTLRGYRAGDEAEIRAKLEELLAGLPDSGLPNE